MSDIFKVIEQASEIADGDYILTVNDGVIKKVAKADANLGGGWAFDFTSHGSFERSTSNLTVTQDEYDSLASAIEAGKPILCKVWDGNNGWNDDTASLVIATGLEYTDGNEMTKTYGLCYTAWYGMTGEESSQSSPCERWFVKLVVG